MKSTFRFETNAQLDLPDSRDYIYQPTLTSLPTEKSVPDELNIRNQGREGACTGFATGAAIDLLNQQRQVDTKVSARMLYEMARKNDRWPGETYEGSSIRGAIKGWRNMGVCSEEFWPYRTRGGLEHLTVEAAKDARKNTIGSYYRLMPEIADFHNAMNEAGVIIASARVHNGWKKPGEDGKIAFDSTSIKEADYIGAHAFVIVGYDKQGFIIQNSWGKSWGKKGLGYWRYEDWIENIMDAWVVSLALPTPNIFGKESLNYRGYPQVEDTENQAELFGRSVNRSEIAGHFVHIDDGEYHDRGKYWSNESDVEETARLLAGKDTYDHLVFYFHGGLNSPKDSARRIKSMKEGFKRNRIYPYHIMYDTGLAEELKDIIKRKGKDAFGRVFGIADHTDRFLERLLRKPGTLVWDEMKKDAAVAFQSKSAGLDALNRFIKHLRSASANSKKIHLVGHSTGAIVIAHLLRILQNRQIEIESCSLLAPAASIDLFHSHYGPVYEGRKKLKLNKLEIYNLNEHLELEDTVAKLYRKSLLYLVSNSFEKDGRGTPILGMKKFAGEIEVANNQPVIYYSNGTTSRETRSKTHGGFDNDPTTMNNVLKTIIGSSPTKPFTPEELAG